MFSALGRARRRRPQAPRRGLRASGSSRCSRRCGRSRPPVPVHLEPVAQPRGDRPRPDTGERRFARVKVPPLLPRFVVLPDGERFVPLEQVIAAHLDALFPGMESRSTAPFRVTRNADLTARGGGGRRPARRGRDGAAPPPLRPGRAPRGRRRRSTDEMLRAARARARPRRRRRLRCTRARSTSAACGRCTASTGPS